MIYSSQQIETITQSVLRELRSRGVTVATAHRGSQSGTPASSAAVEANQSMGDSKAASVAVTARVVTEDTLAAVQAAGRTVSIPAGAVITPSGHDYIRRHSVSVHVSSGASKSAGMGTLLVIGTCASAEAAARAANWKSLDAGCEPDAAWKSRKHLAGPVVCCGGNPSIVACLLNRDNNVRAAVVDARTDLTTLAAAMNPQVVCLDSVGWSFASYLRLFRQLGNADMSAPKKWKELR